MSKKFQVYSIEKGKKKAKFVRSFSKQKDAEELVHGLEGASNVKEAYIKGVSRLYLTDTRKLKRLS